jgi:hypothetical protein
VQSPTLPLAALLSRRPPLSNTLVASRFQAGVALGKLAPPAALAPHAGRVLAALMNATPQLSPTVARVAPKDAENLHVAPGGGRYVVVAGLRAYTGTTELAPGGIPARRGHLRNISIRARAGPGADALIAGVTLADASVDGTTNLLVRGVAPALAPFGVTGTLADPQLRWMNQSTVLAANNDWAGTAEIARATSAAGAFPLPAGSKDAALLLAEVRPGSYTVHVTGHDERSGVALAEVYALPSNGPGTAPRFTNFSARAPVGAGSEILIAGFEVHGGYYDFGSTPLAGLLPGFAPGYRLARFADDLLLRLPPLRKLGSNFEITATRP